MAQGPGPCRGSTQLQDCCILQQWLKHGCPGVMVRSHPVSMGYSHFWNVSSLLGYQTC